MLTSVWPKDMKSERTFKPREYGEQKAGKSQTNPCRNLPAVETNVLTCTLKIAGENLKPMIPLGQVAIVHPDAKGDLILPAKDAELHGDNLQVET